MAEKGEDIRLIYNKSPTRQNTWNIETNVYQFSNVTLGTLGVIFSGISWTDVEKLLIHVQ